MTAKVDVNLLDVSDDGHGDVLLGDAPFSGIAYEYDESTSKLVGLVGYYFGKTCGPSRFWTPGGQLTAELYYTSSGRHGPWRTWYADGSPKTHSYWECDHWLWHFEWDRLGNLIKERKLADGSKYMREVEKRLRTGSWIVIDIDVETMEFFERPQGWGKDLSPEQRHIASSTTK